MCFNQKTHMQYLMAWVVWLSLPLFAVVRAVVQSWLCIIIIVVLLLILNATVHAVTAVAAAVDSWRCVVLRGVNSCSWTLMHSDN